MYLQGDRLDKLENIPNNLLNRSSTFRNLHYFPSAWKVELTDGFHCSSTSSSVFCFFPCSRYVVNRLFLFARGVKACAGRGQFASAAPSPKTRGEREKMQIGSCNVTNTTCQMKLLAHITNIEAVQVVDLPKKKILLPALLMLFLFVFSHRI